MKRPARRARVCRSARFAALAVVAAGMLCYSLTCSEWRERRNPFVFMIPLGFLINTLSVEILFSKLRKRNPPE